jgi:sulfide dehydrogenase [flavocytochrome c] flavoprotein chain
MGSAAVVGCAGLPGGGARTRVLVVGGGFGGATAAKYVRLLSGYKLDVVMVEPNADFVSCPLSNLVLGGFRKMNDITTSYDALGSRHGVKVVRDRVQAIDTGNKTARLASGGAIAFDRTILSPGIDLIWDSVAGLQAANASGRVVQAWKAGPETLALRRQLEAMPDGGVFAITIPESPYRCPPGPYERACQVASYFKRSKPRSKVLVLDANPDVQSKPALFKKAWADEYPGLLEYRPDHKAIAVDAASLTVKFELQSDVKAQVLNLLPAMRAGSVATSAGLANANGRWCGIDYQTFESSVARGIHVVGDAIQLAPLMPKSAHMANAHAKVAAAAVVAELTGQPVDPAPMLTNTCYSFVNDRLVIHIASVHRYDAAERTYRIVPGSGGLSSLPTELEGVYANGWARNIWADTLL